MVARPFKAVLEAAKSPMTVANFIVKLMEQKAESLVVQCIGDGDLGTAIQTFS